MEIKNLAYTKIETIVACLTQSFKNYFVKMPEEVEFWARRFRVTRVDYSLSFGAFDKGELVAFIIHGVDYHDNKLTAFNTGTGVLEAYRGQRLVDQIYAFALPILKARAIEKSMLEVIEQNERAIKVYERIGFKKDRFLRCFSGIPHLEGNRSYAMEINLDLLQGKIRKYQKYYAWDNSLKTILNAKNLFNSYKVIDHAGSDLGYFVINIDSHALIQIESYEDNNWRKVIAATKEIIPSIRINNIDSNRTSCIKALLEAGIENHINQYEMILDLNP